MIPKMFKFKKLTNSVLTLGLLVLNSFAHSMELPPIQTEKLANGLEIMVVKNNKLPLLSMQLVVNVGRPDMGLGHEGELNLLSDVMMEGSQNFSSLAVKKELDDLAADLAPNVRGDYLSFSAKALSSSGKSLVNLLQEIVMSPRLSESDLEKVRARSLALLDREKESAGAYAARSYLGYVFGEHPYSYSYSRHQKNIEAMTVAKLQSLYKAAMTPDRALLVLSGDVSPETLQAAKEFFGKWQGKSGFPTAPITQDFQESPGIRLIHKKGLQQTQVILGHLTIPMSHPDYIPLSVAIESLGGSFDGRLFKRVRTELGLTYGINAYVVNTKQKGNFRISTFTKNTTVAQIVKESRQIYEKFVSEGITANELRVSKNQLLGQFPASIETIFDLTSVLTDLKINGIPNSYLTDYTRILSGLTLEQVNAAVRKHLSTKNLKILIYSDKEAMGAQVQELNPEIIDVTAQ